MKNARRRTTADRVRYGFDNTIARGTLPLFGWLLVAMLVVLVVAALVLTALRADLGDEEDLGFVESFWQSMTRMLDPGTFTGDAGWPVRLVTLLVTLAGIVLATILISLVITAVERKLEDLRRGRSLVVEDDHTLILGWSPRVATVVAEIVAADESRDRSAIVILAPLERREMEEQLAARLAGTGRTRLVCRSGDPANVAQLQNVGIDTARSVVVLGDVEEADGDAQVVKATLAVVSAAGGRRVPIVAEVADAEIARALRDAGEGQILTVRAPDVIARVTAQACRRPGLSAVWADLLDFGGDEIYFHPAGALVGHPFGDALLAFEEAAVLGHRSRAGVVTLVPPLDLRFAEGDEVVVLAEDDDTIVFTGLRSPRAVPSPGAALPPRPERILVVGWNHMGPTILRELDRYVPEGSSIALCADANHVQPDDLRVEGLSRLALEVLPAEEAELDRLDDHVRGHDYDLVLVLGYRGGLSPAEADARTLLSLLLLRRASGHEARIVTELLDSDDVDLAVATGGDDYVVSDALSGFLMAQLSENRELDQVFTALFEGGEVALDLVSAEAYGFTGAEVPFATAVAAAAAQGEVVLGYRLVADTGVELNPPKSATVRLGPDDELVVIRRR